jgi:LSU ribosomal protein L13P
MKTISIKQSEIEKNWWIADAEGQTLGRFASNIAQILRGKHKVNFTPHMDMGDCVVVVNAEKIQVTGSKETDKTYFRHSGFPGGGKGNICCRNAPKTSGKDCRKCDQRNVATQSLGKKYLVSFESVHWYRSSARSSTTTKLLEI